ncbi:MAG TPA: hypothetical protein VJJ25_03530 [Nitrosopumilaceae archaeon]|nr:hypothetical protein [Nitrosopumilaceae archaeon]
MNKKQEKIFVLVAAGVVITVFVFAPWSDSYFGLLLDTFREPAWNDISPHDVVKNVISMTVIDNVDNNCKMSADNLDNVIEHTYFVRGKEFAQAVNYDMKDKTIVLPCEMIDDQKSRLHVWYIKEEAPRFGGKYKYFVTPWNDTSP